MKGGRQNSERREKGGGREKSRGEGGNHRLVIAPIVYAERMPYFTA